MPSDPHAPEGEDAPFCLPAEAARPYAVRERIVSLWAGGHTGDAIADEMHIARQTVFAHLRIAREAGDARAARRKRQHPALVRRHRIRMMHGPAVSAASIAEHLGISKRRVLQVLAEAKHA